MDFIRPEIRKRIWRWREALIGFGVAVLGLYWAVVGLGLLSIIGTSIALAGSLLVFAGIQRSRFRVGNGGVGVVYVDEGRVTYYGPVEGGSVTISNLTKVYLDTTVSPKSEWVLLDPDTPPLRIPINAEGADTLFDVFAGLDGLETEAMLSKFSKKQRQKVVIWESKVVALH